MRAVKDDEPVDQSLAVRMHASGQWTEASEPAPDEPRSARARGALGVLAAGTVLGNYRILHLLGSGGMADVYEAEDQVLLRRVALKVLPPEFGHDPQLVQRFEKEVHAAASLNHSGIVTVFEVGFDAGIHFYSMRLLTGGDLRQRITRGVTEVQAVGILRELADAFVHAHSAGLVHRDVKPENILFDEQGRAVVTDFGIAKAMSSRTRLTATGASIGTPRYISPEQARGKSVDERADLYSLGAILFELLTGRPPFDAEDPMAVIYMHVAEPVPRLPARLAQYQPVVDGLLAKDPEMRLGSAGALLAALESLRPEPGDVATKVTTRVIGHHELAQRLQAATQEPPAIEIPPRSDAQRLREEPRHDAGWHKWAAAALAGLGIFLVGERIDWWGGPDIAFVGPTASPPSSVSAGSEPLATVMPALEPETTVEPTTEPAAETAQAQPSTAPDLTPEPVAPETTAEATPAPSEADIVAPTAEVAQAMPAPQTKAAPTVAPRAERKEDPRSTAAAMPAWSGPGSTTQPAEFSGMLEAHNRWRDRAGVPALSWSQIDAAEAQRWAEQLATEDCRMRFNPDASRATVFRENLLRVFAASAYSGWRRTPEQVVDRWGEAAPLYDPETQQCGVSAEGCTQYAQVVEARTRYVGCGRARCDASEIWVCSYTPPRLAP